MKCSLGFCNFLEEISAAAAAAATSLQSCLTLWDPIDGSPPGSAIPGILQARTLEWVDISFSNVWKWKVKVKPLNHVQLLATPCTAAYQAPSSMGFSRQEYWSGLTLPSPEEISSPSLLLFSSISLCWSRRKALSLLAILWNSAFKWKYLSFSPLLFASLHFTAVCNAYSDNHFAILHFFSMGMVLIPLSCTMPPIYIHSSSGSVSDLVP